MSAANELQTAIYDALISRAALTAIVGSRIYDRVPMAGDIAPFITLGEGQERPDEADCFTLSDHTFTVNVWSEKQGGFKEAKAIVHEVKRAVLNDIGQLNQHALLSIDILDIRYQRDPDGITSHAIVTFEAMIEEN